MDYNALLVLIAFIGFELTFSWNFHKIYVKLYGRFHDAIKSITEKREESFRGDLAKLLGSMFEEFEKLKKEGEGEIEAKDTLRNPKHLEEVKGLYASMVRAEKPREVYNRARDDAQNCYRYWMYTALATFIAMFPAIAGEPALYLLYFLIPAVPASFACIATEGYRKSIQALVELRDRGE